MDRVEKTNAMRLLDRLGIAYTPLSYPHGEEAVDAASVAALLGEAPERIFKTLVLRGSDAQHYVCVVPGPRDLDLKAAAASFGVKSLRMLPVSELRAVTGYERGGCSPLGMRKPLRTLADASALSLPYVIISAGTIGAQIKLAPEDLLRAANAATAPLTSPA